MYFSIYIFYICMYIDDYLIIVTFSDVFLVQNIHSKVKSSTTVNTVNNNQRRRLTHTEMEKRCSGVFQHPAFTKDNYEGA